MTAETEQSQGTYYQGSAAAGTREAMCLCRPQTKNNSMPSI
jgi:hypothetical protein